MEHQEVRIPKMKAHNRKRPRLSIEVEDTVRVTGTTLLSFECTKVGDVLEVRSLGKPKKNRPTTTTAFKGTAYLVFKDSTKIGRLDDKELGIRGRQFKNCTVVVHDKEQNLIRVGFEKE